MSTISAKDVMSLRNRTGLPMMACKKALSEAGGDVEKAEEILRKELKGKMESKVERAAGEGRIGVAIAPDNAAAAIVELKAETDFTAKNEAFVRATDEIAALALAGPAGASGPTDAMTAIVDNLRITTGENISVGRTEKIEAAGEGTVFGRYVHHDGKTGVLIHATGAITPDVLRQIAMHVTAAVPRPLGVTADELPREMIDKERRFRVEQAVESGKPKEIAEKMVEGGMKKFFAEVALLDQSYVVDPSKTVREVVGPEATIVAFRRWEVGESA